MSIKQKRQRAIFLVSLLFLAVMMLGLPETAEAALCERAFMSCMTDALAAGMASMSLPVLSMFATSCALGYDWCLKYYKK